MRQSLGAICITAILGGALFAADRTTLDRGKAEEANSCVACHGLKIIHDQRLPKAAWGRELDKMQRWGAVMENREALLEYLTANFGDDKPVPARQLTGDGTRTDASKKK